MKKFYQHIVEHPKIIVSVFTVLLVAALICKQFVAVNYDMNDYLPEDSASTVALEVMESEYDGGIPNARIMIKGVTIPQALEYKEKLLSVDGVTDVTWLDDVVSVTVPLETADAETVENYYKDKTALFSVTIADDKKLAAVSELREIIGEESAMAGCAVSEAVATESTVSEIARIAVIAVLFTLFILFLTTTSWAEPIVILVGLGVAVLINAGSNIIFGEISFVTDAAGNILQLAVSLDYSVFLLHRFTECRKETPDVKEAMVNALCLSTSSILSSGLTTVIGFLALCMMRFGIGPDLGLALAKGVAISLISVFVFMPNVFLLTYKLIDKTSHRSFMPSFKGFGEFVTKIMVPMVVVFAVMTVPSYLDTNQCKNIVADGATIANVGENKQVSYTILPGKGVDAVITADVTDFEMAEVSINGIKLNLNVEIDDEELMEKVNDLISATKELNDGASELNGNTGDLLDGSDSLSSGAEALYSGAGTLSYGISTLQSGIRTAQSGINDLNAKSNDLTEGSLQIKAALEQIQSSLSTVEVSTDELSELVSASASIKQGISDLYDGITALKESLGYAQYKALMSKNGLDIDRLKAENTATIAALQSQVTSLKTTLSQIEGIAEYESII